jgi:hypothetical protein
MPKATIDKNRHLLTREVEVRLAEDTTRVHFPAFDPSLGQVSAKATLSGLVTARTDCSHSMRINGRPVRKDPVRQQGKQSAFHPDFLYPTRLRKARSVIRQGRLGFGVLSTLS